MDENINIKSEEPEKFDINLVYKSFSECCKDVNALDIDTYLISFRELYKFFMLLGTIFSFVSSDILSKVNILENYRKSEESNHYATIQSMIQYEISNGIINISEKPSGSRTLLRLHRSLEFTMSFMHDFSAAENDAKSSSIAQKCYKNTLSKYHPWIIQKGANLAMYTLPSRQQIIEKVHGEQCDDEIIVLYEKLMGDIADVAKVVYDETQKIYEENNLLDLP